MKPTLSSTTLSLALATVTITGCSGGAETGQRDTSSGAFREGLPPTVRDGDKLALTDTTVDYMLALRSAAIKLTGNLPTLAEIQELQTSPDQPSTYAARIDQYLNRPCSAAQPNCFATQQISFWRNTFHMGGADTAGVPVAMQEFAPTYAAMLVVNEQPITNLANATSGTCPTYSAATGTFSTGANNCASGNPTVGVISDQGVQAQFTSSMAFRRARWLQETFMCARFPAEQNGTKISYPGGVYQNPWPWNSFSGAESIGANARVDFQVKDGLICGNCHGTMNHIAPLLGKFDSNGVFKAGAAYQVTTPIAGTPVTVLTDWLPATEGFGWRFGQTVNDLPGLGAAIAADPGFSRCMATRVWNWAMSRGDVVNDGSAITEELAKSLTGPFVADNYNMKKLVRRVFTDPTFVRY